MRILPVTSHMMSFEPALPPYNAGDTLATFVNASCLDFLFAELVPMTDQLVSEANTQSSTTSGIVSEDDYQEAKRHRLESLGYRVGQGLAERFSRDKPRFTDHLDVIKFLCKDLWTLLFRKQIDNLKTNHRVWSANIFKTEDKLTLHRVSTSYLTIRSMRSVA